MRAPVEDIMYILLKVNQTEDIIWPEELSCSSSEHHIS